jgi:hypothetical protein
MNLLEKLYANLTEIILITILILVSAYFLFFNLFESRLIDPWETSYVYLAKKPLVDSFDPQNWDLGSTFPFSLMIKLFPFKSFPEYRYGTSFLAFLSVLLFYFLLRYINLGKFISFFSSILISVNSIILLYCRICTSLVLTLFLSVLTLLLYFVWRNKKQDKFLFLIFIFLALMLNNHMASFYFVISFLLWFIFLTFKKTIKIKSLLLCFTIFAILLVPYYIVLANTPKKDFLYFFEWRYKQVNFEFNNKIYLPNIQYLDYFVRILSTIFNIEYWNVSINLKFFIIIYFTPLIIFFIQKNRDEDLNFLFYLIFFSFLILLLSFVPVNAHYFLPFIIIYICLLAKQIASTKNSLLCLPLLIISGIIFLVNMQSSMININENHFESLNNIWPKDYNKMAIEQVPFELLKFTPIILNNSKIFIFACSNDGISSVNYSYLENYSIYSNISFDYDPQFFNNKKLEKNDIIVFGYNCMVQSKILGINATENYGLNNSYTKINFPIEPIGIVEGIIIYRIV